MTTDYKELAEEAISQSYGTGPVPGSIFQPIDEELAIENVAAAIREAVEAEREVCAGIAYQYAADEHYAYTNCGAEIGGSIQLRSEGIKE